MLSQQQSPTKTEPLTSANRQQGALLSSSCNVPNLFVIGAMKASTTTFYELITRHPDIWFTGEKEPHYFTSPRYGQPEAWQAYLQHFATAPASAKFLGEASTGYSKLPHFGNTPSRLRESLDYPRFIYLVRDPVERTISNYQHSYLAGHYAKGTTLTEAVAIDPILVDASCYARQIRAYREVFGKASLLIIPTNQLHAEPIRVMRRVETFLHLPAYDDWSANLAQSNSRQAMARSVKLQAVLPRPVFSALKKVLPRKIRAQLKQVAARAPNVPPITEAERQHVFALIADDLQDLVTLVDGEVSQWVSGWPSVQQLGGR